MQVLCVHGYGVNSNVSIPLMPVVVDVSNDHATYRRLGHKSANGYARISRLLETLTHGNIANKFINADGYSFLTAPLRQELRLIFGDQGLLDFTYLQGELEAIPPYPGVAELFSPPFYKFWDGDSPSSVLAATDLIASSISTNDPDVIFAHSDGAAAALTTILYHPHNVKCLVLLCPIPPFDAEGRRRLDVSLSGSPLIHTPTIFVRGESDPMAPFVAMTEGLVDKRNMTLYSYKGGHEVPNSSERTLWTRIAQKVVEILKET